MAIAFVTGTSTGIGAATAVSLARAGHTVYAGMRDTKTRNAPQVEDARNYAKRNGVDLRTVELDVLSDDSVASGMGAFRCD